MTYFSELKGKKVLVTGGSKGIGKDIALAFAKQGADVVITGRNEADLVSTTNELKRIHPYSFYLKVDIQDIQSVHEMVDNAVSTLGNIDILINNAGINIAKPALEVTEKDWNQVIDTNLKGTFFCAQRVGKHMIEQGGGKIVNMASQMAFVGYIKRSVYCSSKGGAVQLTKALAVEWAPYNVRVNAVAPTFIETDFTREMFEDQEFYQDVVSRIPLGKLAQPSDVTGAVLFLASDLAQFITGETIKVDGGWTAI
ncbi:SDR family NAD(P)-dependent oxidoreductase [Priestia megaterium]|uniref:SDR family NAD(P)-dependent oxidoreductase n=1 Tax=Priestia megaterium TaxID=1404 RepID=UPI0013E2AD93|nr:SDR family NAD(P)-dependent oxidoreductase [Priestia megaterium]MED3865461.1 SDR family NAD(P)-dependent oxidoreductase [Priestia megaterium]MED4098770.1 SDR family NAD(P)-dependent oxidoreductase [Priestia megaterium]MED4143482.1 SDR family NAD(P)-dependent oxidoreductase [Priestia megaterium]MED4166321.1 SDR family NAD(P)-dependent oxidoreductase [Priestia megaterium]MED4200537.1 SDR family NAD(P)-dependent oxidoreductase [Priestia megaterium]